MVRPMALGLLLLSLAAVARAALPLGALGTQSNIFALQSAGPNVTECYDEFEELMDAYMTAPTTVSKVSDEADHKIDCDPSCLRECHDILMEGIYSTDMTKCPATADLQRCFVLFSEAWEDYVKECQLFIFTSGPVSGEAAPSADVLAAEGEATPAPTVEAEGEATPAPTAEGEASPAGRRLLDTAEGEATPAPSTLAAEGEATPAPTSEAAADPTPNGCFPPFADAEAFEEWIDKALERYNADGTKKTSTD